jgi:multisubunit Na+/H+ antiporter MnhB subunit
MVNATTPRTNYFTTRTLVAYLIAYALAAVGIVISFFMRSVPWLAFGAWLAASLTVLLVDRAVGERTPRRGAEARENFGAIFQGSPAALTVIAIMAVAALAISFFAHW